MGVNYFIFQPIICVEQRQCLEEVSDEEGEAVFEEVVGSFFKGDSEESIPVARVASLEFLGEGFVSVVGHSGGFEGDSDGGGEGGE